MGNSGALISDESDTVPFWRDSCNSAFKMIAFIRFWTGDRFLDRTPVAGNGGNPTFWGEGSLPEGEDGMRPGNTPIEQAGVLRRHPLSKILLGNGENYQV